MTVYPRNLSKWLAATVLISGLVGACGSRTDREGPAPAATATATATAANPAHAAAALPPVIAARLEPLQARLVDNPQDLDTRKEIAVILLNHGQLLPAFEHAEEILRADPDDSDGLYVHGVVRIAMGQGTRAIEIFDQLLLQNPNHVPALTARGRAAMKLGDVDGAIASWERGLAAAGGRHAGLEKLLRQARDDLAGRSPAPAPRTGKPAGGDVEPAAAGDGAEKLFHLRIELAPGTRFEPGATLVASLRSLTGGPAAAVKTVSAPSFPLELTLGPADSVGSPLPVLGILSVQLGGDGNTAARDPQELSAEAAAVSGNSTKIVLAAG